METSAPIRSEEEPIISQFRALVAKFEESPNVSKEFFARGLLYLRHVLPQRTSWYYGCPIMTSNLRHSHPLERQIESFKAMCFDLIQAMVMGNEENTKLWSGKLEKLIKQMEHVLHMSTVLDPANVLTCASGDETANTAIFGAIFRSVSSDLVGM
jgi:hypothetical protein